MCVRTYIHTHIHTCIHADIQAYIHLPNLCHFLFCSVKCSLTMIPSVLSLDFSCAFISCVLLIAFAFASASHVVLHSHVAGGFMLGMSVPASPSTRRQRTYSILLSRLSSKVFATRRCCWRCSSQTTRGAVESMLVENKESLYLMLGLRLYTLDSFSTNIANHRWIPHDVTANCFFLAEIKGCQ